MTTSEFVVIGCLLRISLLGLCLWCGHFALRSLSPRWRIGLWRVGAAGVLAVAFSAMVPPLFRWTITYSGEPKATSIPMTMTTLDAPKPTQPVAGQLESPVLSNQFMPAPASLPYQHITMVVKQPFPKSISRSFAIIPVTSWEYAVLFYGAVTTILSMRFLFGLYQANRIVQAGSPAPQFVVEQAKRYCQQLKIRAPRIIISSAIPTPSVIGCRNPVVILPESVLTGAHVSEDLQAGLAHELAHIAGRDLVWECVMQMLSVLLWGHPLFWKMPAAHRAACERVRDVDAAELTGNRDRYRSSLARFALQAVRSPTPALLMMASQPEILGRLQALSRGISAPALGKRGWVTGISALLVSVGLGTSTIALAPVAADPPASLTTTPSDAASNRATAVVKEPVLDQALLPFEVTVLQSEDDAPLADVAVQFWTHKKLEQNLKTDALGKVVLQWPAAADRKIMLKARFQFIAKAPGRVPYYASLGQLSLDNIPAKKTIRMQRGTIIGGVIEDEQGTPVEGASTTILIPATDTESQIWYQILESKTGPDGRWLLDSAPEPIEKLSLIIEHPRFPRSNHSVQAGKDVRYRIEAGWNIQGTVTDQHGHPVKNAIIHVGHDRFGSSLPKATTDGRGRYELFGLPKKDTLLTVSSLRNAPQMKEVLFQNAPANADFQLEQGHSLKVKIVDQQGKPLPKASLGPDTWRGHRSLEWNLKADANGEIHFTGAPPDVVEYGVHCEGYSYSRNQALIAREEPYVLTMKPVRDFDITVIDAKTAAPISEISAKFGSKFPGQKEIYWMEWHGASGRHGKLHASYSEPEDPLYLRIESAGYEPWISDPLPLDQAELSFIALLNPGAGPAGQILTPQGEPAQNAQVHLVTDSQGMQFSGDFLPIRGAQHVTTDHAGKFQLQALDNPTEPALVAIVHETGYLELPLNLVKSNEPVQLSPWARLEVMLQEDQRPVSGAKVNLYPNAPHSHGVKLFSYGLQATTNAQGAAVFERCPPFSGIVGRELKIDMENGSFGNALELPYKVNLKPAETARVTIGEDGRVVMGRVVLPPDPPVPHLWKYNGFGGLMSQGTAYDDPTFRHHYFQVNPDGTFRIPGVIPGNYNLTLPLTAYPNAGQCSSGVNIGMIRLPVDVTDSADALELGDINTEWNKFLRAGDPAPKFSGLNSDHKIIRSGDYDGKWLVLDFWAMWCSPCLAEMPLLQDFANRYVKKPGIHLEVVAINLDQDFDAAVDMARKRGCQWPQLQGDSLQSATAQSFNVHEIPVKFLVDPSGTIRYRGNDLRELSAVLDQLLGK